MTWKQWLLLFLAFFVIALCVQVLLERMHRADSIGFWYTLYSAIIYAAGAFVLVRVISMIVRRLLTRPPASS